MNEIMNKSLCLCDENDLRAMIDIRRRQFIKAQERADKFGSIRCEKQAINYQDKYCRLLWHAKTRGYKLTEEEAQIAEFGKNMSF